MMENLYKNGKKEATGTEDIIVIDDDLYDELEDEILGYRTVTKSATQHDTSVSEVRTGNEKPEQAGFRTGDRENERKPDPGNERKRTETMRRLKLNLTIKRMLTGLVGMGVFVTLLLSLISLFYSNNNLINSQKQLTEIVLPLDTVTQKIRMATADFVIRKHSVREARSLEKLEQLSERRNFEQAFAADIRELGESAEKAKTVGGSEHIADLIKKVEKLYSDILDKDSVILESVRNSLTLENDIRHRISNIDSISEELYKNTDEFSDKISLALRNIPEKNGKAETVSDKTAEADLNKNGTPLSSRVADRLIRARKLGEQIRVAAVFLSNCGYRMMSAEDPSAIARIKSEKIDPVLVPAETALRSLSDLIVKAETPSDPDADSSLGGIKAAFQKINSNFNSLKSAAFEGDSSLAALRILWLAEQENLKRHDAALTQSLDSLTEKLKDIRTAAVNVRNLTETEALRVNATSRKIIISVCMTAIFFMIGTGWLIIRRIILPINKAVSFADIIAKGDLTAEIQKEHDDEVGLLVSKLSEMAHNLNALIGQVQRSGIQVTSSATELSATSKQQEAVMRTQLESTNYVVKSVGEISEVSEGLVQTMKKVAAMSDQTADFASSGQTDLAQMEEAMHHMENASKSISGKLEAINEKAANITSVVTTITKVADQTNLLSLNAAIEAEKAGEYGRGFTVVAREIRRLADQTAVATLDIDQMVQEMQSAVSAGVMEMDAFIAEVQRSAENVGKISMQLSRIIEQVQALSPSFEGVNESMQLQYGNAQQINNSMVSLSEEMQQTVDSLRESFLAIEQLNDAARGLQEEVSKFKVM
jgi:methyl-accepting chemotaxis protein WspA